MLFLYALFVFLPALASLRPLEPGEARAFQSIYGTRKMEELVAIERDPVRFWREREAALIAPGATITHREFCRRFVQEAKEHIAQNCQDSKGKASFKDGEALDEALQSVISDDHPAWPTIQARFYGQACDCLSGSDRSKDFSVLEKDVAQFVQDMGDIKDDFNDVQRWLTDPCAEYAIVDNIIMYRRGLYLSSSVAPEDRCHFQTHYEQFAFVYTGWKGVIEHDSVAHAAQQYKRDQTLKTFDISPTEHFKMYCGPEYIEQGNIITQSHQHLGWFYNVHELPSVEEAYNPKVLETVLFPYAPYRTDSAFGEIVPFFTLKANNWQKTALHYDVVNAWGSLNQHAFLLRWRERHCDNGWDVFSVDYFSSRKYTGCCPNTEWVHRVLPEG